MRKVECQNCIYAKKTDGYEVLCRYYGVLKLPYYKRICPKFIQRRFRK